MRGQSFAEGGGEERTRGVSPTQRRLRGKVTPPTTHRKPDPGLHDMNKVRKESNFVIESGILLQENE